jgi:D-serine deaminase-like pyridoxal phosphate-dependent protein
MLTITDEEMDNIEIGDLVGIIPAHSCLCADLMKGYQTTEGGFLNHIFS